MLQYGLNGARVLNQREHLAPATTGGAGQHVGDEASPQQLRPVQSPRAYRRRGALRGRDRRDRRGIVTGSAWTANPSSFGRSCDDLCAPTGRRREDAMVGGVVDVGLGYQHSQPGQKGQRREDEAGRAIGPRAR